MYTQRKNTRGIMSIKSGENPNDEVNQTSESSAASAMTEHDLAALNKIQALSEEKLRASAQRIPEGTLAYRLQQGSHDGSSVFFNHNGKDCRYSLTDGIVGSMYLAFSPETTMKEVFQNKIGLRESDLASFFMGEVVIQTDVDVLSVNTLVQMSSVTIHDVTTSTREVTQALAQKAHSAGFGGMQFPSNVTGNSCLVLWHENSSGEGFVKTQTQTSLTNYEYNGKEAADILVQDLGIPVEE